MNDWISINEIQPEVNELVLICKVYKHSTAEPIISVSYWDGTYDEYMGQRLYKFPDGQDEQPGYHYPTHWMALPKPPVAE
jgi:hypothetical protein